MSVKDPNDLSEFSMVELFRLEVENQSVVFTENLLALEQNPTDASRLGALMRAAHSLKGAARMVDLDAAVVVANELEEVFVAAQGGSLVLLPVHVDVLLRGVDLLHQIAQTPDGKIETENSGRADGVQQFIRDLDKVRAVDLSEVVIVESPQSENANAFASLPSTSQEETAITSPSNEVNDAQRKHQRFLRVTPENLNRLLALTGESLVESRRLVPFAKSLLRLKREHNELAQILDRIRESLGREKFNEHAETQVAQARVQLVRCREDLSKRLVELEEFHRRSANLSHRLYDEALACRMRPFADGIQGFPRMVRDLARDLGKQARLEIPEKFLGERELGIKPLDPRLGKIKDISSGALLDDGSPVLIVDVEDLIRSVEKSLESGTLDGVQSRVGGEALKKPKRVLVVDDSLTVRELEKKLLRSRGYEVEIAVDGMDAWNAARTGHFDLVVTDVDMPRMDGIEFVTLIKKDANLKSLPVMIVSYKDRAEDRRRGLEAGADYYLAKASFHDEALLQAVVNLIGEATE